MVSQRVKEFDAVTRENMLEVWSCLMHFSFLDKGFMEPSTMKKNF